MEVPAREVPPGRGRQERVKACQGDVNTGSEGSDRAFTEPVTENLIAAIIAVLLIAYLVYALARPDKF